MPETAAGATTGRLMSQAARRFADRIALRAGARSWTFRDFDGIADALATALAERLEPGSRVALLMANRPEYLMLQAAIERAGLVRVPVNARATTHETATIFEDCRPGAVFHDSSTADRVGDGVAWRIDVDAKTDGFDALLRTPADVTAIDRARLDALASINYTSGSSGRPKGVCLTHRNWAAVYRNMLVDRDVRGDDVIAHIGPLTHASGTYFVPWFLRGATNVIVEDGQVETLLHEIDRRRVSVFTCVPTVLTRIVNHSLARSADLGSLRMIGYGAEPIPHNTLRGALELFGPILVQNYGLTEAMMTCATLSAEDHVDANGDLRIGCIGRPYTFVEVVLRAADGTPVAAGEIGEITVRSDHMMQGYWGLEQKTADILRDGWLWSGDLGRMDAEGLITLTGRSKDMLISGGFNIYPQELETALTACEDVMEAAVVGQADPDWGEIAVAFVVLAAGSTRSAGDIIAAVKKVLGIRTPKRVEIVAALPKNANGKVDKNVLRARLTQVFEEASP